MGDGSTGIVIAAPTPTNPHFRVRLELTKEVKEFPRSQLRPLTHELGEQYRSDLGYGRGQRVSREVQRTDRVDMTKMTDKQFDRQMRESDKAEDEVCVHVLPCCHV